MSNFQSVSFDKNVTPIQFLQLMFEHTGHDGKLYLEDWLDVDSDELDEKHNYCCEIKWNQNQFDELVEEYRTLYESIKRIAEVYDLMDGTDETVSRLLKRKIDIANWYIFVEPINITEPEKREREIIGRVGDDLCGYDMINHANRLCRLMYHQAPDIILWNEGRMLIASLALNWCGVSMERMDLEE